MLRKTLLVLLALLLTACATLSGKAPLNEKLTWAERQQQLAAVQDWTLSGAVGIRSPKQGVNASINWHQQARHYDIELFGPLGAGHVQLSGSPGQARLTMADAKQYTANSAETLLQQHAGYRLPISNLYYWVRGLPAPGSAARTQFDQYNHLTSLQQQGWTIRYNQYAGIERVDLPSTMTLVRPGFRIRLVIKQWKT